MNLQIRRLMPANALTMEHLLLSAYANSKDVILWPGESFCWSPIDARSTILGVWHGPQLVSILRGTVASTPAEIENLLHRPLGEARICYPALVLSRAATANAFRGKHLTSLLRSQFIRNAIKGDIQMLVGVLDANARRAGNLQALGYRFTQPEPYNPGFISKQSIIATLRRDTFPLALEALFAQLHNNQDIKATAANFIAQGQSSYQK